MRSKCFLALVAVFLLGAVSVHAAVLRVVVVQTSDAKAYSKALDQGKALMKSKGLPANLRMWRARFAGDDAGAVAVAIEYASLEEFAKADAMMQKDPELSSWLASLSSVRKIVSDSVYEEMSIP